MTRPLPAWDPAVDDVFVCTAVRRSSATMTTLVLAPRTPCTVAFDAGQYISIEFEVNGVPITRSYTLSSPPTRPERLEICVGHRAGGTVSPLVGESITVGTQVTIGPPQGEFTRQAHPSASAVLLTAGSGITPALAMLREIHDLGDDADVVAVHAQRRPHEIAHRTELETLASEIPGVAVHFVCSDVTTTDRGVHPGRLDGALVSALVPDVADREVFVCGPDSFRSDMRAAVLAAGCPAARVHEEAFSFETEEPSPVLLAPTDAGAVVGHTVEFRDHGVTIVCPPDTTLLSAATAAGVPVASSCGEGVCGTCKHTVVHGDVDMTHAGGIRPREIAAGKVLLCCSRPRSDVVVTA